MTGREHLDWAKQRALEFVDRGDGAEAVASMISDLGKHEDLWASRKVAEMLFMTVDMRDMQSVRKFIEGFN
jgi:hypothetical protein